MRSLRSRKILFCPTTKNKRGQLFPFFITLHLHRVFYNVWSCPNYFVFLFFCFFVFLFFCFFVFLFFCFFVFLFFCFFVFLFFVFLFILDFFVVFLGRREERRGEIEKKKEFLIRKEKQKKKEKLKYVFSFSFLPATFDSG